MLRFIKFLHSLASIGLMGGMAALVVLLRAATEAAPSTFAGLRGSIDLVYRWLLVPSMVLVVLSGFVSMFMHKPFRDALWVSLKAVSGVAVLEFTFRLQGLAREATALAVQTEAGTAPPGELADALRAEWLLLWMTLVVCLANVVLGVWRPRFRFIRGLPQSAQGTDEPGAPS
jgi:hypothetical protein